jgi:hypothetical protein
MSDTSSKTFAASLGEAVLTQWGTLPREVQRRLFEAAVQTAAAAGDPSFRDNLAVFLHDHHPRTDDE